jgi:hypothetical protein
MRIGRIGFVASIAVVFAISACGGPSRDEQYDNLKGDLKAAGYVNVSVTWSDETKALSSGDAVTINIEPAALAHTPSRPKASSRPGGASTSKPAAVASTGTKASPTSSASASKSPAKKKSHKKYKEGGSTPELQTAAMLIAGCSVTIERERGESAVMRKIAGRDIEYFEIEVGDVDVENDALPQSPTRAELEEFLRGNASQYDCAA